MDVVAESIQQLLERPAATSASNSDRHSEQSSRSSTSAPPQTGAGASREFWDDRRRVDRKKELLRSPSSPSKDRPPGFQKLGRARKSRQCVGCRSEHTHEEVVLCAPSLAQQAMSDSDINSSVTSSAMPTPTASIESSPVPSGFERRRGASMDGGFCKSTLDA